MAYESPDRGSVDFDLGGYSAPLRGETDFTLDTGASRTVTAFTGPNVGTTSRTAQAHPTVNSHVRRVVAAVETQVGRIRERTATAHVAALAGETGRTALANQAVQAHVSRLVTATSPAVAQEVAAHVSRLVGSSSRLGEGFRTPTAHVQELVASSDRVASLARTASSVVERITTEAASARSTARAITGFVSLLEGLSRRGVTADRTGESVVRPLPSRSERVARAFQDSTAAVRALVASIELDITIDFIESPSQATVLDTALQAAAGVAETQVNLLPGMHTQAEVEVADTAVQPAATETQVRIDSVLPSEVTHASAECTLTQVRVDSGTTGVEIRGSGTITVIPQAAQTTISTDSRRTQVKNE